MNRLETIRFQKPFLEFVLSIREESSDAISFLRGLASLALNRGLPDGQLKRRIDRVYFRLCRVQEELGTLDFKKAQPGLSSGTSLEDYVFSRIDFSRYREITETVFEYHFLEGVSDFSGSFFRKNFNLDKDKIHSLIKECYEKANKMYQLKKENPLILSVMRALEISLETSPLFTIEEIQRELYYLQGLVGAAKKMPIAQTLFSLLILSLENESITHKDGTVTKLFISPQSELSGTFYPGGKPWTKVLIPAEQP